MRFFSLLILLVWCGCVTPSDPGKPYIKLALKPNMKNALACVATYDEFCSTYHFPKGQRNRQWIQRLRLHTAKKLLNACTDARLKEPMLRKLWAYPKRTCHIKKNRIVMEFKSNRGQYNVVLDSCRTTPSGRVLPSVFRFYTQTPHPNGVK